MMNSSITKYLGMASWVITALVSLHVGLSAMGWNIIGTDMIGPWVQYVVGAAGLVSLILFIMALTGSCCKCGSKCNCAGSCSCR